MSNEVSSEDAFPSTEERRKRAVRMLALEQENAELRAMLSRMLGTDPIARDLSDNQLRMTAGDSERSFAIRQRAGAILDTRALLSRHSAGKEEG